VSSVDHGTEAVSASIVRSLAVGLAAGFLSGLFGVGGGVLLVPALVFVLGMDQRRAHGTSLAAVLPMSAASLVSYWVSDDVDWAVAGWLVIGAVAGAIIGAHLLDRLPQRTLGIAFSVVLLVTAVRLFLPVEASGRSALDVATAVGLVVLGFSTGVLAGLLGVGGGIVMVPAMVVLVGMPPVIAKGTSVAVVVPTAIMGTWRNRKKKNADLSIAAVVGCAGIASAVAGVWVAQAIDDDLSNVLFALLLTAVAVKLLRSYRHKTVE
jgi:uncharacterized protein